MKTTKKRDDVAPEKESSLSVNTLRNLFKNLQQWESTFETDGVATLTDPLGTEWHLTDVQYLYSQIWRLPPRQREAIQIGFYENQKEVDTAIRMGVSPSNPVFLYAAKGLESLIKMIRRGDLERFAWTDEEKDE